MHKHMQPGFFYGICWWSGYASERNKRVRAYDSNSLTKWVRVGTRVRESEHNINRNWLAAVAHKRVLLVEGCVLHEIILLHIKHTHIHWLRTQNPFRTNKYIDRFGISKARLCIDATNRKHAAQTIEHLKGECRTFSNALFINVTLI